MISKILIVAINKFNKISRHVVLNLLSILTFYFRCNFFLFLIGSSFLTAYASGHNVPRNTDPQADHLSIEKLWKHSPIAFLTG